MGTKKPVLRYSEDDLCPLTERPHEVQAIAGSPDFLICEGCLGYFVRPDSTPDAQDRPRNDAAPKAGPTPVGQVRVDPEANQASIELSPEGLRVLANNVIMEMAKTQIPTDLPHMIAFTMLGVALMKQLGLGHNEVMQVVSIAWNGDATGLFVLAQGKEEEVSPIREDLPKQ